MLEKLWMEKQSIMLCLTACFSVDTCACVCVCVCVYFGGGGVSSQLWHVNFSLVVAQGIQSAWAQ